jgi:hypothetical protein
MPPRLNAVPDDQAAGCRRVLAEQPLASGVIDNIPINLLQTISASYLAYSVYALHLTPVFQNDLIHIEDSPSVTAGPNVL